MDISSVCIVGGSGFVGRSVADHLCARGLRVRVLTRSRPRAMPIAVLPTAEIEVVNPHDAAALARAFENMDAVVNLVGILNEGGGHTFRAAHVELPRRRRGSTQEERQNHEPSQVSHHDILPNPSVHRGRPGRGAGRRYNR